MTQDNSDLPFQHYTTKHRIIAWVSKTLFDGVTYTVRHGLLEGMKRKGGLGWLPEALSGGTETAEHSFWKQLDLSNRVVYDIGAFQGLLTLFFARQAKTVVCYEPNSRNNARLQENLRLNGLRNVVVRKVGLGSQPGEATMVFSPLMPGGASVEAAVAAQIGRQGSDTRSEQIRLTTLDQDLEEGSLPPPGFIKIDIEGFELAALQGARQTLARYAPPLFLEMHGDTMNQKRRKVAELVKFLESAGYGDIRHVETGTHITVANSAVAAQGHLYCQAS